MKLEVFPITFKEACLFVERHHRHHKPPVGHKFSICCSKNEGICGVAIVGRPVARMNDNGMTLEVTRLATDGTRNACSFLYAKAWQAARALGYKRLITYILSEETGASLSACDWKLIGETGGGSWSRKSRPRLDKHPLQKKLLFEMRDL